MGKSQLAFALEGSRPWFYWPTTLIKKSQLLHQNFSSVSEAFRQVTNMDDPTNKSEEAIFNSMSSVYTNKRLWTFGFIRALLRYCSKEQNQHGQMIRFQKDTSLFVDKCDLDAVEAFREKMKAERKVLPFFVLDEMTLNSGEKNLVAFQLNVFRVCGLAVVVVGTDVKITQLLYQPLQSYTRDCAWMTVVPRFPPYQPIPFADEDKQTAWNRVQTQYPVLNSIVVNSRGLFARYFVDSVVQYAVSNSANGMKLYDLLDVTFYHVSLEAQRSKPFMGKQEGKDAQLMAISYANAGTGGTSPPSRKKREVPSDVGTHCMHLHFANLVDHENTDIIKNRRLFVGKPWKPWEPSCRFPTIEKDLLLYLAVLGGKTYSGYYDHLQRMDHSTVHIFSAYSRGQRCTTGEHTNAVSNFRTFENMIAHMIFCASQRNGVQGIPFDDFFAGLLSECQDQIQPVTMTIGNTTKTIVASDLLDKYADLAEFSRSKIPFLAPPNAEWPQWILDTRNDGCNFGHLVCAWNDQRCDICVCNMEDLSKKTPLFLCECKFSDKSVDLSVMDRIICGLDSVWEENWAVALVFCVRLATFSKKWHRNNVGCVKVDCRSCRVDWVFQPAEGDRKKLVIAMETGSLAVATYLSD